MHFLCEILASKTQKCLNDKLKVPTKKVFGPFFSNQSMVFWNNPLAIACGDLNLSFDIKKSKFIWKFLFNWRMNFFQAQPQLKPNWPELVLIPIPPAQPAKRIVLFSPNWQLLSKTKLLAFMRWHQISFLTLPSPNIRVGHQSCDLVKYYLEISFQTYNYVKLMFMVGSFCTFFVNFFI